MTFRSDVCVNWWKLGTTTEGVKMSDRGYCALMWIPPPRWLSFQIKIRQASAFPLDTRCIRVHIIYICHTWYIHTVLEAEQTSPFSSSVLCQRAPCVGSAMTAGPGRSCCSPVNILGPWPPTTTAVWNTGCLPQEPASVSSATTHHAEEVQAAARGTG